MARLPGLGRTAGAAPYVAIAVGIISGQYIFNQPLKAVSYTHLTLPTIYSV